ncbi:MAG: queuosine salvage family protein [Pseudomonadota bacterium]
MFEVLDTSKKVAETSDHVHIDQQGLRRLIKGWVEQGVVVPPWNDRYHFNDGSEKTVSYLLVLDSLNFCFWPSAGKKKWEIDYESGELSGYYALSASLKRAVESGIPITRADYLAELSYDGVRTVLGGRGDLQLFHRRCEILNELGRVLLEDYDGRACRLVEDAGGSAVNLTELLAKKLASFRDTAVYKGQRVFFYKRAQIVAADLHGAFEGKAWGLFGDMGRLTSFADYKVPQVLRHVGVLRYTRELAEKVDQMQLIEAGSSEEVEIRANTIRAVQLMKEEMEKMGRDLKAYEIDWILWNMGQHPDFKVKPYHRTLTIFY